MMTITTLIELFLPFFRNLEDAFSSLGGSDVKILDRTAVILEIFAQHAQSREGENINGEMM